MSPRYAPAVLLAVAALGWTVHHACRPETTTTTATAVRQLTDPKAAAQLQAADAARHRADRIGSLLPLTLAAAALAVAVREGVRS